MSARSVPAGWPSPDPDQDHTPVPLGARWKAASTIAIAVFASVAIAAISLAGRDDGDPRFAPVPVSLRAPAGPPEIEAVDVELADDGTGDGRIRVRGDDIDRVEVTGGALCRPASGGGAAWIPIERCGPLTSLTITATDGDDETSTAVVEL